MWKKLKMILKPKKKYGKLRLLGRRVYTRAARLKKSTNSCLVALSYVSLFQGILTEGEG